MYAASTVPQIFSYNFVSRQISVPDGFNYNEQTILMGVDIGYYGFGVPIMLGTSEQKFTVTNYNYVTDQLELRWKSIDQFLNLVVPNAI
jgi:hypothetical protein